MTPKEIQEDRDFIKRIFEPHSKTYQRWLVALDAVEESERIQKVLVKEAANLNQKVYQLQTENEKLTEGNRQLSNEVEDLRSYVKGIKEASSSLQDFLK